MTTSNVTDGTTSTMVDTGNLTKEQYNVSSTYQSNNTYQTNTTNSLLNIIQETSKVIGNCNTNSEWIIETDNHTLSTEKPTADTNGIHSGTYRYIIWNQPIPRGAIIKASGTVTPDNQYFIGLNTLVPSNDRNWTWLINDSSNKKIQYKVDGRDVVQKTGINTSTTFNLTIDTSHEDKMIWTYNGTEYVLDPYNYTDTFYFMVRKWGAGEITVNSIEYELK